MTPRHTHPISRSRGRDPTRRQTMTKFVGEQSHHTPGFLVGQGQSWRRVLVQWRAHRQTGSLLLAAHPASPDKPQQLAVLRRAWCTGPANFELPRPARFNAKRAVFRRPISLDQYILVVILRGPSSQGKSSPPSTRGTAGLCRPSLFAYPSNEYDSDGTSSSCHASSSQGQRRSRRFPR